MNTAKLIKSRLKRAKKEARAVALETCRVGHIKLCELKYEGLERTIKFLQHQHAKQYPTIWGVGVSGLGNIRWLDPFAKSDGPIQDQMRNEKKIWTWADAPNVQIGGFDVEGNFCKDIEVEPTGKWLARQT